MSIPQGKQSLAETHPELAKQWSSRNMLRVEEVTAGSGKKAWWLGECGHEWEARICNRTMGRNCPVCGGYKTLEGFNDLFTLNPTIASEWSTQNKLTPQEVSGHSGKKVWWIGKCGHEWEARIDNRVTGVGCPYCSNQQVLAGFNDFATLWPDLAMEWSVRNATSPQEITAGSHKKIWWRCVEGHEWAARVFDRVKGGGCPNCCGVRVSRAETQLLNYLADGYKIFPQHTIYYANGKRRIHLDGFFEYNGLRFALEYDGSYWHSDTVEKDVIKTRILLSKNYYVIRIRENTTYDTSEFLPLQNAKLLQLKFDYTADYRNLPAIVDQIKTFVEQQG